MVFRRWRTEFLPGRIRSHFHFVEATGSDRRADSGWIPGSGRILVLAPHSDDEVLGPGGTAALHALAGAEVCVGIVNDGQGGGPDDLDDGDLVLEREKEAMDAGKIIGIAHHAFAKLPDRSADSWEKGRSWLRSLLDSRQPERIYAPSPFDEHADHLFTSRLLAAELEVHTGSVEEVCSYEVWTPLLPNRVIDISAVAETKRRAIRCYPTQTGRSNIEGALMGLGAFRAHRHLGESATCAEAFFAASPRDFVRIVDAV